MASKTKVVKGGNGKAPAEGKEVVAFPDIELRVMEVAIVGDSPLVMNRFSEKAQTEIEESQGKNAKPQKEARNPEAEYKAATHRLSNGKPGFPAAGFKKAAVGACRYVDGIPMTEARGAFFVLGDLVPILGSAPKMRTDMVRIKGKTSVPRYRPEFTEWSAVLTIRYNASALSAEQIIHLIDVAGFGVGVGEWRPQKDGSWGMWHVEKGGK